MPVRQLNEREGSPFLLPASYAQRSQWLFEKAFPGNPASIAGEALRLSGPLDVDALTSALAEIVQRHETLRTAFEPADGDLTQVVAPHTDFAITIKRAGGSSPADIQRWIRDTFREPFDLSRAPLFRVVLWTLHEAEHLLLATIHLSMYDGWSRGIFERELAAHYSAFAGGAPSPLEPLDIQYADFAAWQRQLVKEGYLDDQLRFWRDQCAGIPTLQLPADLTTREKPDFSCHRVEARIPLRLAAALYNLRRRQSVTPFIILLALFQLFLSRLAGQTDITVATPSVNRNRQELLCIIGRFVNWLPVRGDLRGDYSFSELLARTKARTLAAFRNQDIPMECVREKLSPQTEITHDPWARVALVFHGRRGRPRIPGVEVSHTPTGNDAARYELELHIWEEDAGMEVVLLASAQRFFYATALHLLGDLLRLAEAVAESPDRRVSQVIGS